MFYHCFCCSKLSISIQTGEIAYIIYRKNSTGCSGSKLSHYIIVGCSSLKVHSPYKTVCYTESYFSCHVLSHLVYDYNDTHCICSWPAECVKLASRVTAWSGKKLFGCLWLARFFYLFLIFWSVEMSKVAAVFHSKFCPISSWHTSVFLLHQHNNVRNIEASHEFIDCFQTNDLNQCTLP